MRFSFLLFEITGIGIAQSEPMSQPAKWCTSKIFVKIPFSCSNFPHSWPVSISLAGPLLSPLVAPLLLPSCHPLPLVSTKLSSASGNLDVPAPVLICFHTAFSMSCLWLTNPGGITSGVGSNHTGEIPVIDGDFLPLLESLGGMPSVTHIPTMSCFKTSHEPMAVSSQNRLILTPETVGGPRWRTKWI